MTRTIFISHSADDEEILKFFRSVFDDTNVKPVTMEYEKWSRNSEPNWKWITKQVRRSRALFVILTRSVASKVQTQNWISFEIGVAAGSIPKIPVYVFMEEEVNFPVPYLNHYFPKPFTISKQEKEQMKGLEALFKETDSRTRLQNFIKNPHLSYDDKMYRCSTCMTVFSYWDTRLPFYCPCCSSFLFSINRYYPPKTASNDDSGHKPV